MSTLLGPAYPPIISKVPPHMAAEDYDIYLRWWPEHAFRARAVYYDVYLGDGAPIDPVFVLRPAYQKMWTMNTQKRADMVVDFGTEIWLIELRHAATSNAIGRLLQYKLLYAQDPPFKAPLRLVLVTDSYDPDLQQLATQQRVDYYSV